MANNGTTPRPSDQQAQVVGEWPHLVGNLMMSCILTSFTVDKLPVYLISTVIYGALNLARFLTMGRRLPSSTIIFIGLGLKGIKLQGWKIINVVMFIVSLVANMLEYYKVMPKWARMPGRSWIAIGVLSVDVLIVSTYLAYLSKTLTHRSYEQISEVAVKLTGLALSASILYMLGYPSCLPLIAYTYYTAGRERVKPQFMNTFMADIVSERMTTIR